MKKLIILLSISIFGYSFADTNNDNNGNSNSYMNNTYGDGMYYGNNIPPASVYKPKSSAPTMNTYKSIGQDNEKIYKNLSNQ